MLTYQIVFQYLLYILNLLTFITISRKEMQNGEFAVFGIDDCWQFADTAIDGTMG
jgi:hypothetical protein